MEHMSHEEYMRGQRERVVAIAEAILAGRVGIIEGSRALGSLRHDVTDEPFDPDFITFVAIGSDTDHLPVGVVREKWADSALAKKDKEIKKAEDFYRESALNGCRVLIERFETEGGS